MPLSSPVNTNVGYPGISKYIALINPGSNTAGTSQPSKSRESDPEWLCDVSEADLRRLPAWAQPLWLREKIQGVVDTRSTVAAIYGASGKVHSHINPGEVKGSELTDVHGQLLGELEDQQFTMAGYVRDEFGQVRRRQEVNRGRPVDVKRRIKSTLDVEPLMTLPRPQSHCEGQQQQQPSLGAGWHPDEVESRAPDIRRQLMPITPWRDYRPNRCSNNLTDNLLSTRGRAPIPHLNHPKHPLAPHAAHFPHRSDPAHCVHIPRQRLPII
ncbi:hypothetical protein B0H13DRAFT_1853489 [Mycena leptocephala]|nr:hypothetical protein B0H13DRAFT_1853489 [Mycena leptocephala]